MKSMGIDYPSHPLSARKDIETQEVRLMVGREPKATLSEGLYHKLFKTYNQNTSTILL